MDMDSDSRHAKLPGKQTFPLVYRVKTPRGWRSFKPIVRPTGVFVADRGQKCQYPGGRFFLKYWQNNKRHYEPLNLTPPPGVIVPPERMHDLILARTKDGHKRLAKRLANLQAAQAAQSSSPAHQTLSEASRAFLLDLRQRHKWEMERQANYFFRDWHEWPIITRQHILDWMTALRAKGTADRTIKNRYIILRNFLKWAAVAVPNMPPAPTIPKPVPRVVPDQQLAQLLATCSPLIRVAASMASQLGLRHRELMFAAWSDIDWDAGQFTVTEKPDIGFTIKTRTGRRIAMAEGLLALLREHHEQHPTSRLILETRTGKPCRSLLKQFKSEAARVGLNPAAFFGIQGLRRKFVTTLLRRKVDIKTTSVMAGHSSIAVTQLYAEALEGDAQRDLVNNIFTSPTATGSR